MASPVRSVPSEPFQVGVFRRGADVDLARIVARNFTFWASGPTAAYCPLGGPFAQSPRCPLGEDTVFRDISSLVSGPDWKAKCSI